MEHSISESWKNFTDPKYEYMHVITTSKFQECRLYNQSLLSRGTLKTKLPSVSEREGDDSKFETNMEKDIFEQPRSIKQSMLGRVDFEKKEINLKGIDDVIDHIARSRRLILVGAASSYHVALACRQLLEELLDIPIFVEEASNLLDREVPIFRDEVYIFISQSGETKSVLNACKYCKDGKALVMGIINGENSRLHNETHFGININAGKEVGITSTKTYTSQFIVMVMFALKLASNRVSQHLRSCEIISEMKKLPENIETVLKLSNSIKTLAKQYVSCDSFLVIGRGFQYATSLEGSFKLIEVANIHSEAINSGELKHGTLALIDSSIPIIFIIVRDSVYSKSINALQQVKARGGKPIVICEQGDETTKNLVETSFCIPKTSDCLMGVLAIIPLQLLAFHLAKYKQKNIDSPNNLQKFIEEED